MAGPFAISKSYTVSLHEKSNLYADLDARPGKKCAYCQLQVVHNENKNGKTYADVTSLMAFKGTKPDGAIELVVFDKDAPD